MPGGLPSGYFYARTGDQSNGFCPLFYEGAVHYALQPDYEQARQRRIWYDK